MDHYDQTAVVIPAAGLGTRFGAAPKIWADLDGRPILAHVLEVFQPWRTVVVAHAHDHAAVHALGYKVETVEGGSTRSESVHQGLLHIQGQGVERVLVHDGARPLVSRALVDRILAEWNGKGGVVPVLPATDTLWSVDGARLDAPADRALFQSAQTPQAFHYTSLLAAYREHQGVATDDATVARAGGMEVLHIAGEPRNFKITTAHDLAIARALLAVDQVRRFR